jgi:putative membrane protein
MRKNLLPTVLLLAYVALFVWSGIHPFDRGVWLAEALTSAVPVVILIILYFRNVRLSGLAYILMFIFPMMHIVGAHYTFANVPFDWFNDLFGFTRNMYDRVAHMSVGFYALGIAEIIMLRGATKSRALAWSYALFAIMALAGAYELFEWQYAVMSDPSAGIAVLGAQGDIWDAQKDILMDTIGAIIGVLLFMIFQKKSRNL